MLGIQRETKEGYPRDVSELSAEITAEILNKISIESGVDFSDAIAVEIQSMLKGCLNAEYTEGYRQGIKDYKWWINQ